MGIIFNRNGNSRHENGASTEKIDFSISKLRFQIYVILKSRWGQSFETLWRQFVWQSLNNTSYLVYFFSHLSFLHNLNYLKKVWTPEWRRTKCTLVTAILNFICFVLIEMFVMAYDQTILIMTLGPIKSCRVSFAVDYNIQFHFRLNFYHGSKHYEPWSDCSMEQSDLDPYCLQYMLPKNISRR